MTGRHSEISPGSAGMADRAGEKNVAINDGIGSATAQLQRSSSTYADVAADGAVVELKIIAATAFKQNGVIITAAESEGGVSRRWKSERDGDSDDAQTSAQARRD